MISCFRKIGVFALVLGFVLAAAPRARAQEADNNIIRPITKQGSAAMIFELAGIGTFGFSGPGIFGLNSPAVGMKYFLSDDMALFVLAGLSTSSGSSTYPDSTSAKPSSTTFGIGAGVQMHFRPLYSTSPYVGGMISFGNSSSDNGASGNADSSRTSSTFGVSALAGFDWFFTHGLCLGGEMSLGFTSTSTSRTGPNFSGTSTTTSFQPVSTIALYTSGSVHLDVFF